MTPQDRTPDFTNSELLAKWMGWTIEGNYNHQVVMLYDDQQFLMYLSNHNTLYHTRNMAGAWEVLQRAIAKFGLGVLDYMYEADGSEAFLLFNKPAAEAQRWWLNGVVWWITYTRGAWDKEAGGDTPAPQIRQIQAKIGKTVIRPEFPVYEDLGE